eukprot:SAG11_NODE_36717_length_260_cov_0.645963_1_plen_39_part_01
MMSCSIRFLRPTAVRAFSTGRAATAHKLSPMLVTAPAAA